MAEKKDIQEKEIIELIKKYKIKTILDIFNYYTKCSRQTFYVKGLDKSDNIKNAIDDNKRKACESMLSKWIESDNPTLQIAAYRICCSDSEKKALATNYNENNNTGTITINWNETHD